VSEPKEITISGISNTRGLADAMVKFAKSALAVLTVKTSSLEALREVVPDARFRDERRLIASVIPISYLNQIENTNSQAWKDFFWGLSIPGNLPILTPKQPEVTIIVEQLQLGGLGQDADIVLPTWIMIGREHRWHPITKILENWKTGKVYAGTYSQSGAENLAINIEAVVIPPDVAIDPDAPTADQQAAIDAQRALDAQAAIAAQTAEINALAIQQQGGIVTTPAGKLYNSLRQSIGFVRKAQYFGQYQYKVFIPQAKLREKVKLLYMKTIKIEVRATLGTVTTMRNAPLDDMVNPNTGNLLTMQGGHFVKRYMINTWDSKPLWSNTLTRNESVWAIKWYKDIYKSLDDRRIFSNYNDPYRKAGLPCEVYNQNGINTLPVYFIAPISQQRSIPGYEGNKSLDRAEYREDFSYMDDLYALQLQEKNLAIYPYTAEAFEGHKALAKQIKEYLKIIDRRIAEAKKLQANGKLISERKAAQDYANIETTNPRLFLKGFQRYKATIQAQGVFIAPDTYSVTDWAYAGQQTFQTAQGVRSIKQDPVRWYVTYISPPTQEELNIAFQQKAAIEAGDTNVKPEADPTNWLEFAYVVAGANENNPIIAKSALALMAHGWQDYQVLPNSWFIRILLCAILAFNKKVSPNIADDFVKKMQATIMMQAEVPDPMETLLFNSTHNLPLEAWMIDEVLLKNPELASVIDPANSASIMEAARRSGLSGVQLSGIFSGVVKFFKKVGDEYARLGKKIGAELKRIDKKCREQLRRFDRWWREEGAKWVAMVIVVVLIILAIVFTGGAAAIVAGQAVAWSTTQIIVYCVVSAVGAVAQYNVKAEPMKDQAKLSKQQMGAASAMAQVTEAQGDIALLKGDCDIFLNEFIEQVGLNDPDTILVGEKSKEHDRLIAEAGVKLAEAEEMVKKIEIEENVNRAQEMWAEVERLRNEAQKLIGNAKLINDEIKSMAELRGVKLPEIPADRAGKLAYYREYYSRELAGVAAMVEIDKSKKTLMWGFGLAVSAIVLYWGFK